MNNLRSHINSDNFSQIIKKTLSNKILVGHIEEAAWNFLQDRTDNNLEIRGWLARYAGRLCELCVQNIDHVSKPDFNNKLRKYKFQEDCWSVVSLHWLQENMPIYAEQLEKDFPWKIKLDNRYLQYFLAKILWTLIQMFFANYYDFDYRKLLMSEEEFMEEILSKKNDKQIVVPLSGDIIEDQKIIKKTVDDIKSILDQERAKLN